MTNQHLLVPLVAALLLVGGFAIAFALPIYTCDDPYRFEEIEGPGAGPICIVSDTGYQPRSWLPTKITVACAGIVVALAVLLWRRRRPAAVGLIVTFAVLVTGWFLLYGEQGLLT